MCKPPRKMPDAMPVITILMFLNTSCFHPILRKLRLRGKETGSDVRKLTQIVHLVPVSETLPNI